MKKIILLFFLLITGSSFNLSAETSITGGSFLSFYNNDNRYSPNYIYFKAASNYLFDSGWFLSSDFDFIYGMPLPYNPQEYDDRVFTNYLNGSTRFITGYNYKNRFKVGSITNLSFFSDDSSFSIRIQQGNSSASFERKNYITQEVFFTGSMLDKKLNFLADFGYKFQEFSDFKNYSSSGKELIYSGTFQDSDIFAFGHLSYGTVFGPFAEVRFGNDLNQNTTYNMSDLRAGFEGDISAGNRFHIVYQAYYKRLETQMIDENNHIALYSRMRASVLPVFDLFLDGYLEYSINDDGKAFFVNRNMSLLGRFWIFDKTWNISTGMTVLFDYFTYYDTNGVPSGKIFIPLWPFIRSDLYFYKSDSFFKNFRGFVKFITKIGEQGEYKNYSFRLDSGLCALIGPVEPAISFRWLTNGSQFIKTAGIDLSIAARF
ncbi:MAG TPA: hypothetical protein PKG52_10740 [bacterium]|nr:hypothetical protein [bacterium]HPS30402.1 hypothetical protein [bacterium]